MKEVFKLSLGKKDDFEEAENRLYKAVRNKLP